MPSASVSTTVDGEAFGAPQRAKREPDVLRDGVDHVEPAIAPDASHRVARERDVAEFLPRRQSSGCRIFAAVDALLDADRQVAANLFIEVVVVRAHTLLLVRGVRVHDPSDRVYELGPPIALAGELRFSRGCEPVVLRALIRLAHAPFGLEPSALLEPVQRGIERAGLDLEQVVGLRADRLADAVSVLRSPDEGPKDEHVEGALEELEAVIVGSVWP